jgi:hypothetical protein
MPTLRAWPSRKYSSQRRPTGVGSTRAMPHCRHGPKHLSGNLCISRKHDEPNPWATSQRYLWLSSAPAECWVLIVRSISWCRASSQRSQQKRGTWRGVHGKRRVDTGHWTASSRCTGTPMHRSPNLQLVLGDACLRDARFDLILGCMNTREHLPRTRNRNGELDQMRMWLCASPSSIDRAYY